MAFAAAHRGLSSEYAENTIAALRAAVIAGFPCLEVDLRCTADGEVVIIHDAGIERTTDGNGRVADMTYEELRSYDTGEGPIPRFDDALTALADWKGHWNIEIKAWKATAGAMQLARHHGILDRMQLSSMDPRALAVALAEAPEVPRGLIVLGPPDAEDIAEAKAQGCSWINVDADHMNDERVDAMVAEGLRVGVWTVNDPGHAVELVGHGAECIMTDVTDVLAVVEGKASFT